MNSEHICNLTVARMQKRKKKKKKGLHTRMWGVFKALVGKIANRGFLHPQY